MIKKHTKFLSILIFLNITFLCSSCNTGIKVVITGTIRGHKPTDEIFVALSRDWEKIYVSPRVFEIDSDGRFYLEFKIRKQILPITFVKNNRAYARLSIENMWSPHATLVDEIRNKSFPITVDEQGVYKAVLKL